MRASGVPLVTAVCLVCDPWAHSFTAPSLSLLIWKMGTVISTSTTPGCRVGSVRLCMWVQCRCVNSARCLIHSIRSGRLSKLSINNSHRYYYYCSGECHVPDSPSTGDLPKGNHALSIYLSERVSQLKDSIAPLSISSLQKHVLVVLYLSQGRAAPSFTERHHPPMSRPSSVVPTTPQHLFHHQLFLTHSSDNISIPPQPPQTSQNTLMLPPLPPHKSRYHKYNTPTLVPPKHTVTKTPPLLHSLLSYLCSEQPCPASIPSFRVNAE